MGGAVIVYWKIGHPAGRSVAMPADRLHPCFLLDGNGNVLLVSGDVVRALSDIFSSPGEILGCDRCIGAVAVVAEGDVAALVQELDSVVQPKPVLFEVEIGREMSMFFAAAPRYPHLKRQILDVISRKGHSVPLLHLHFWSDSGGSHEAERA